MHREDFVGESGIKVEPEISSKRAGRKEIGLYKGPFGEYLAGEEIREVIVMIRILIILDKGIANEV